MSDGKAAAAAGMVSVEEVKWWAPLVMGIIAIVFGLLLLSHPAETSIWVAWLIGIWWLISGVMNLAILFVDRSMWGWKVAMGVLGIFAGMVVLDAMSKTPLLGAVGLGSIYVLILGIQGLVYGIIQIVHAFQGGGWGMGIMGVLSVIFGGLLMANPLTGALVLPWVFAVFALAGGIAAIVMAFKVKGALAA